MKKFISILTVLCLLAACFAGCGASDSTKTIKVGASVDVASPKASVQLVAQTSIAPKSTARVNFDSLRPSPIIRPPTPARFEANPKAPPNSPTPTIIVCEKIPDVIITPRNARPKVSAPSNALGAPPINPFAIINEREKSSIISL